MGGWSEFRSKTSFEREGSTHAWYDLEMAMSPSTVFHGAGRMGRDALFSTEEHTKCSSCVPVSRRDETKASAKCEQGPTDHLQLSELRFQRSASDESRLRDGWKELRRDALKGNQAFLLGNCEHQAHDRILDGGTHQVLLCAPTMKIRYSESLVIKQVSERGRVKMRLTRVVIDSLRRAEL